MRPASVAGAAFDALRVAAALAVLARFLRGARRLAPVRPDDRRLDETVSVVIPARDEVERLAPCLDALRGDPQVHEVLVVDDESTDGTADLARRQGATVVPGRPLPPGWVGKPWALEQGLREASGEWVLTLDADTVPVPGLVGALVGAAERHGYDVLTVGGRFVCETAGERFLHPAMLTTLLYRFGPPGARRTRPPARTIANGQCLLARRADLLAAGGFGLAAGNLTDDIALARRLAERGRRVGFLDGTRVVEVRMHESLGEVWRHWGRSLPMPDATPPGWAVADLGVVWLAQALPMLRVLTGRADPLDVGLLALRAGALVALAGAYRRRGPWYWLSPLADPAVAARYTHATLFPGRTWRGRTYGRGRAADPVSPPLEERPGPGGGPAPPARPGRSATR
ncbi:MAG: glycosyltransferase [Acidimicrobiales bacterium]|nr:glycosyltransferase [Acidimicrobiales bacterium]